jgi:hypothetical protein
MMYKEMIACLLTSVQKTKIPSVGAQCIFYSVKPVGTLTTRSCRVKEAGNSSETCIKCWTLVYQLKLNRGLDGPNSSSRRLEEQFLPLAWNRTPDRAVRNHAHYRASNKCSQITKPIYNNLGARGGAVTLQDGRSRVRFPIVSLEFFIDIILPAALWPRVSLRL